MTLIKNILLFLTAGLVINVHADECNIIQDRSPSLQLFRYLFCDYDSSERPTTDPKNVTSISFMIIPKVIDFDDYENTLRVHSWIYIAWHDDHLHWKPPDYSDIDTILVRSHYLWTPDFTVHNAASANSVQMAIPLTNCMLVDDGAVACIPSVLLETRCDADYSYWPFDIQNCSIQISSGSYKKNEVAIRDNFDVLMRHYQYTGDWVLLSVHTEYENRSSKYSKYDEFSTYITHFMIQRVSTPLWRVYGTQITVLAVLTLSTLWLDPQSNERLMLGCVNFFCHFTVIKHLHWVLPSSDSIPNILIFYHNSTILTAVALILTCLFRKLIETKDTPPPWIVSLVTTVISSRVGQILLLSILDPKASALLEGNADDNSDLVNSQTPKKSTWAYVVIILGWISFLSILLTYIIMFATLLRFPDLPELMT